MKNEKEKTFKNLRFERRGVNGKYKIMFWIGLQGFTLNADIETLSMYNWYKRVLQNAFDALIIANATDPIEQFHTMAREILHLEQAETEWFLHAVEQEKKIQKLESERDYWKKLAKPRKYNQQKYEGSGN